MTGSVVYLPNLESSVFVGRNKELNYIYERLNNHESHEVTVYGREGIGKTRLAYEYAVKHKDEYNIVYWICADSY